MLGLLELDYIITIAKGGTDAENNPWLAYLLCVKIRAMFREDQPLATRRCSDLPIGRYQVQESSSQSHDRSSTDRNDPSR